MTHIMHKKMLRPIAGLLVLVLCFSLISSSALAQPPRRPGPPGRPYGPPPPPPPRRGPSDLDKALAIVGTVGAVAAIANNSRYGYYRYPSYPSYYRYPPRPVVVVPPQPAVVVERPVVVEKQVVVERQVAVPSSTAGSYSPKLGASFRIENMQIPGYKFTAARLMSDPVAGSPLYGIGLRTGDVLTRLDNNPADSLAELERHERNTTIRYIKTGTTKVLQTTIYIPTDTEVSPSGATYNAP